MAKKTTAAKKKTSSKSAPKKSEIEEVFDDEEKLTVEMTEEDEIPTLEIKIGKTNWVLYSELPYPISSKIMAVFLNAAYKLRATFTPKLIKTLLDEIVLSVVKSPYIDSDFIKSARCPRALSSVALQHFVGLMNDFKYLTGIDPDELGGEITEDSMKDSID